MAASVCLGSIVAANAQQTILDTSGTYNGHYYEVRRSTTPLTWTAANVLAQSLGGHLATVGSAGEMSFLLSLSSSDSQCTGWGPWIGLVRNASGVWGWVTGEPFSYSNWQGSEPIDTYPNESYGLQVGCTDGHWYNVRDDPADFPSHRVYWYYVEYETVTYQLSVSTTGSGSGTVMSSPSGINCGGACSMSFNSGTQVTLTAIPASGSAFGGWLGSCTGTGSCTVTMDQARSVTATFNATAPTANGLQFGGTQWTYFSWLSHAYKNPAPGVFELTNDGLKAFGDGYRMGTYVGTDEIFDVRGKTLYLKWEANGAGSFMTVNCWINPNTSAYPPDDWLLSTQYFSTGNSFNGSKVISDDQWYFTRVVFSSSSFTATTASGNYDDQGGNSIDTVTRTPAGSLDAVHLAFGTSDTYGSISTYMVLGEFRLTNAAPSAYQLSVSTTGNGSGTVTSSPSGISCGSTCSAFFNSGTQLILTASPASGSMFAGWSGACTGTGTCTVTMNQVRSVSATFNVVPPSTYLLSVSTSGNGSGTATSSPSGISCPSSCAASFPSGTQVTLTASPATGSVFAGWSGTCTGSGTCAVTMDQARSATATFNVAGPPTITFTASLDRILQGATTTLSWSVLNATTVTIDNDIGTRDTTGSIPVQPSRTTKYILTAVGSGGSAFGAVTVRVNPALQVSTFAPQLTGVAPFTTTFQAIAGGGVPPYTYVWSTGDRGQQIMPTWTNAGRYNVNCTATDAVGNQMASSDQTIVVTLPNVAWTLETLDPNPARGNAITTNPAALTRAPSVTSAAADGATIVLLRFNANAPGSVKFSFSVDGNPDDSGLSTWGAEEHLASVTQRTTPTGTAHQAFAVYHVASDFWRSVADDKQPRRQITFLAEFTPDLGGATALAQSFWIVRPPLVFIHGIWSGNKSTWRFNLAHESPYADNKYEVSWDGYTSIANNIGNVDRGIQTALGAMRSRNIAVTRVDIIAHSMGGLLARAWGGDARYARANNYNKGDYHTLTTLNTPHAGSPLANILITLRDIPLNPNIAFVGLTASWGMPISSCGSVWVPLICPPGAIDDLRVGSDALKNLPRPRVPMHALVGEAGINGAYCVTLTSVLAKLVSVLIQGPISTSDEFSLLVFGELRHDQIVGSVSQKGGLPIAAVDEYTACPSAHTNATASSDYSNRLARLLDSRSSDKAFSVSGDEPASTEVQTLEATRIAAVPAIRAASSATVTIDSPQDGTALDGNVPLTVRVSATGLVKSISLLGDRVILDKTQAPYEFTVFLPGDVLGQTTFVAVAEFTDGTIAISEPVNVNVRRNLAIESLQLGATSRALMIGNPDQLYVQALFADGILRDVTRSTLGTTYTSGDDAILSVSQDGILSGRNPGTTTVTARNGAAEATTFVFVVPAPSGRQRAVAH